MIAFERVGDLVCAVGESPTWNAGEGAFYWVDIPGRRIWRLDPSSGALRSWESHEMTACVAAREGGGLIAGMESGIFSLALGDGPQAEATLLAAPDTLGPGKRFNDGRTDRQGRFWSGTMFEVPGRSVEFVGSLTPVVFEFLLHQRDLGAVSLHELLPDRESLVLNGFVQKPEQAGGGHDHNRHQQDKHEPEIISGS